MKIQGKCKDIIILPENETERARFAHILETLTENPDGHITLRFNLFKSGEYIPDMAGIKVMMTSIGVQWDSKEEEK